MFKYISEIIGKFSMTQRITALVVLLIAITTITLGPSILDAVSQDNEELNLKVERQRRQLILLSNEVDSLTFVIRKNQRDCTNQIIEREEEIYAQLDRLERELRSRNRNLSMIQSDTIVASMKVRVVDNSMDDMMNGIKKIKKDIKVHVEECKENGQ
jgi:TolA-binding protein